MTKNSSNDIAKEQIKANKELIALSTQAIDVIKKYFKEKQYYDYTKFNYGNLEKTTSDTINTDTLHQVVKTLANIQKVQRIALDMDKEIKEQLPTPVIDINFGEGGVNIC